MTSGFSHHREGDGIHILAVNMFSVSTDVTSAEVFDGIQMSLSNCSSSVAHCRMVLLHQLTYHGKHSYVLMTLQHYINCKVLFVN